MIKFNSINLILLLLLSLLSTSVYSSSYVEVSTLDMNQPVISEKKLVIIGASYASGWPLDRVGCLSVDNKGRGGEQSHETLARFNEDALSSSPDAVLIWGFINDLHRNPKEDIDNTKKRAIDSIKQMVAMSLEAGVIPVLATEVTMGVSNSLKWKIMSFIGELRGKTSYQSFINSNVQEVNHWIRKFASDNNLVLIDIEKVMTNEKGNRKEGYATDDGSHITEEAYAALTNYAVPVLEKAIVSDRKLCP